MTGTRSTKHLEMLQAAIARMAGYCFLARGWSVTLAIAILGLAAKDADPHFLWIGALSVTLFWLMDAYYLGLEKGFRTLFTDAVGRFNSGTQAETFDMTPARGVGQTLGGLVRPAVLMVHPPLLAAFGIAAWLRC